MKEINYKDLKQFKEDYLKNDVQKVLRSALSKTNIHDVIYKTESQAKQNFNFSIDLKTLPATNQNSSGRCWIFAGLNVLRELAAKKYNVANFEFSQNYIAFYDKLEKINFFIESMDDFLDADSDDRKLKYLLMMGIQDGGQWDMFVSLVNKYGLVVKEAMPETFQSSNTMLLNHLVNVQLRKYVSEARRLYKDNKISEIAKLKEEYRYKLYKLLSSSLGVPPETFDFEYVDQDNKYHLEPNISPLSFYKSLEVNLDDYVSIINSPTLDKPFNKNYTIEYLGNVVNGKIINHLNLKMERLVELVVNQLKDKEVVWFGCDVSFYNDRVKGIWDDSQLDYSLLEIDYDMSKEDRLNYLQGAMNHAMVITGVNLENDRPTKWKIQNSWGPDKGNKGYYFMNDSWFLEHVYQAVVHKKYLKEEELKQYQEKPTLLKPWDPMGSLAK